MKSMTKIAFSILITGLAGCASHSMMRGSVAMKISESEAHVCMGNNEVKVGDKVNVFKNNCNKDFSSETSTYKTSCKKELVGQGEVTSLVNEHYSVVKFEKGVKFEEGTVIEKQ